MAISRISLLAVLSLSTALVHASDLTPEKTKQVTAPAPRVFTNMSEMDSYSIGLENLVQAERYDFAERFAFPLPTLSVNPLDNEFYELYSFRCASSLGDLFIHKGRQENLNPSKAIEYYKQAVNHLKGYLEDFGGVDSKNHDAQIRLYNICIACPEALDAIVDLLHDAAGKNRNTIKKLAQSSVEYFEKAVSISQNMSVDDADMNLLNLKMRLFNAYIQLRNFSQPSERNSILAKAKQIHHEFKNNKNAERQLKDASLVLKTCAYVDELEIQKQRPHGHRKAESKRVHEIESQKSIEKAQKLSEFRSCAPEDSSSKASLKAKVNNHHKELKLHVHAQSEGKQIVQDLLNIEKLIHSELVRNQLSSTLSDVYQKYEEFLGEEALHKDMLNIILSTLVHNGEITLALERFQIISDLEIKRDGSINEQTWYIGAAIKNLNGDFTEWEMLEQKMAKAKKKAINKKKRKNKNKGEQKTIEELKKDQLNLEEARAQTPIVGQLKPSSADNKHVVVASEPQPFELNLEEKELKKKRHEEAEKERQDAAASSTSSTSTTTENVTQTLPVQSTMSVPLLKDLIELKGVAKDVDEEIEGENWKISREQLIAYFEFLGCTAKSGGKHHKVSLPPALIIQHQGKTLTIINDLGGALTLPRWDGAEGNGTVPNYLRAQIQAAREKLALLILKASELKKAKEKN